MGRVAIITDSTADLSAEPAAAHDIRIVPLYVRFGDNEFQAGVDLSTAEFWARMVAPDAPFPTTAAASPGDFQAAFEAEFAAGAEAIVCVSVGDKLSATLKSAELGAQGLPGREIHLVDSASGLVETADKVRTRVKARARTVDLLTARPVERIAFLHSGATELDAFRTEVLARLPGGVDPAHVTTEVIGPSVGPHVGPGCVGAVVLQRR